MRPSESFFYNMMLLDCQHLMVAKKVKYLLKPCFQLFTFRSHKSQLTPNLHLRYFGYCEHQLGLTGSMLLMWCFHPWMWQGIVLATISCLKIVQIPRHINTRQNSFHASSRIPEYNPDKIPPMYVLNLRSVWTEWKLSAYLEYNSTSIFLIGFFDSPSDIRNLFKVSDPFLCVLFA